MWIMWENPVKKTEWTVGYFLDDSGHSVFEYQDKLDAAAMVNYLNGGERPALSRGL